MNIQDVNMYDHIISHAENNEKGNQCNDTFDNNEIIVTGHTFDLSIFEDLY